eukprot:362082-Chlamydomonas_euryale.AAC.5
MCVADRPSVRATQHGEAPNLGQDQTPRQKVNRGSGAANGYRPLLGCTWCMVPPQRCRPTSSRPHAWDGGKRQWAPTSNTAKKTSRILTARQTGQRAPRGARCTEALCGRDRLTAHAPSTWKLATKGSRSSGGWVVKSVGRGRQQRLSGRCRLQPPHAEHTAAAGGAVCCLGGSGVARFGRRRGWVAQGVHTFEGAAMAAALRRVRRQAAARSAQLARSAVHVCAGN